MAAKLSALAILLAAALALVSAAHATATTTVEETSDNPFRGGGMCRDQFRMADELSHCQDMVMEMCGRGGCRGGRFGFGGRGTEYCRGGRCGGMMGGEGSRHMRPCCQQLRMMGTECRCEGLREMMMEQMMEMGGMGGRDMEEMVRNLPSMCGMEPGMCHMGMMRHRRWA